MKKKREWTQADIDRMQAPAEQYAIVLKSNYRKIGGKVWQEFGVIRAVGGKIKLLGHYLLSVLNK